MYPLMITLHVLGATVWTGGHLVLVLGFLLEALRRGDPEIVRFFESRYERVGIPALVVQVVTGLWLATVYVPDVRQWLAFDTPVSRLIGVKLLLLAATVALAADARLRLIPRLGKGNLQALAWHIVPVSLVAVLLAIVGVGVRLGGWW
ncbi:CopD family protein [Candidatus Binatia bacterium]|nr:CopD family protein [Candidatus Binatia bacterium]